MIALVLPVVEPSQVGEARRRTAERARSMSFDDVLTGQLLIIVSELATNLLKFARDGCLLVSAYEVADGEGIQVLALDKGPGISDIARCLEEGYSTAGSAGHGLGAVRRLAHGFAIASWPSGTAVMARIGASRAAREVVPCWAALEVPLRGEQSCGDAICARRHSQGWTIIVADGLGHGPQAAEAAVEALRLFRKAEGLPPGEIVERIHQGLRHTRGAAVAVSRLNEDDATLSFAGIGNIAAVIVTAGKHQHLVSLPGTAGHNARKITTFDHPLPPNGLLVMHSDGLSSSWSLDEHPGLFAAHPAIIAGVLFRDRARVRDDASVIVARNGMSA